MGHMIRVNRAAGYRFAIVDMDGAIVQQAKSASSWRRDWASAGNLPRSLIYCGEDGETCIERVRQHSTEWQAVGFSSLPSVQGIGYLDEDDDPEIMRQAEREALGLANRTGQPVRLLDGWGTLDDVIEPA